MEGFLAKQVLLRFFNLGQVLLLLVLIEDRPDVSVGFVDLLSAFGACQHYFATRKDEQHDLRILHFEDESREQFRLIVTSCELVLLFLERFKLNAKANVTAGNYILDLEISHLHSQHQGLALLRSCLLCAILRPTIQHLLNSLLEDFASLHCTMLRFRPSNHHLTLRENKSRSLRFSYAHDDSRELAWIVLSISAPHGYFAQVKARTV